MKGEIDRIPAEIFIKHYGNLKRIQRDYAKPLKQDYGLRGIWIHGPHGAGKSSYARELASEYDGDPYPKMLNKWWECY